MTLWTHLHSWPAQRKVIVLSADSPLSGQESHANCRNRQRFQHCIGERRRQNFSMNCRNDNVAVFEGTLREPSFPRLSTEDLPYLPGRNTCSLS